MGRDNSHEHRAIFLDRDGVINRNFLNPATGQYEAPLAPEDFEFVPGALDAMRVLRGTGFLLFLVSNQPNYAKGKSSLKDLRGIHAKFVEGLTSHRIRLRRLLLLLSPSAGRWEPLLARLPMSQAVATFPF